MKLSDNFVLEEFLVSAAAARMGRKVEDPPDEVVAALKQLCVKVLQPLRAELGRPLVIISGYRPEWLNTKVGGSRNSSHLRGEAADFYVPGMKLLDVAGTILEMNLPFDQLIYEFGQWLHVSYAPKMRREVLTAKKVPWGRGFKTQYTVGLPNG